MEPLSVAACLKFLPELAQKVSISTFTKWPQGIDAFMPLVDKVVSDGVSFVLKVDGERTGTEDNGRFTAVISGTKLGERYYRVDSDSLEGAVAYVIVNYARDMWGFRPVSETSRRGRP
jgi:hypothetical protein